MADSAPITLRVDGVLFEGWKSAGVTRSIENVAGQFRFTFSEKHPGWPLARKIRRGAPAVVAVGDAVLVTGHIDATAGREAADGIELSAVGRDVTADLVDCAPDLGAWEWRNQTLEQLARIVAKPFGIPVVSELPSPGDRFPKVSLNPGQKAFEMVSSRAAYRSAVLTTDGRGSLVIARPGAGGRGDPLVEGENMKVVSWDFAMQDRFSDYKVLGQAPQTDFWGNTSAPASGEAQDADVGRHRPLTLVANNAVDAASAARRARSEARVRAARGDSITVAVVGWRRRGGELWAPNLTVPLRSTSAGVDTDLIVSSVEYRQGTTREARLRLMRPDAFSDASESVVPGADLGRQE